MYLYLQDGESPLVMALSRGHFEIVKHLLEKRVDVNCQNEASFNSIVVIIFNRFYFHVPDGL